eukprot:g1614.t1
MAQRTDIDMQTSQMREVRFFGWDPVALVNDMYNILSDYMADGVDCVCSELARELKRSAAKDEEAKKSKRRSKKASEADKKVEMERNKAIDQAVENGGDKLLAVLRTSFDKNFDKFEVYALRNIFRVDEDLRLDNDGTALKVRDPNRRPCGNMGSSGGNVKSSMFPAGVVEVTEESERELDNEMLLLRRQIARATQRNVELLKQRDDAKMRLELGFDFNAVEQAENEWSQHGLHLEGEKTVRSTFGQIKSDILLLRNAQRRMQRLDVEFNPKHGRPHMHVGIKGQMRAGDTPAPPRKA